ncbi:MAG: hypothetical protein IPP58_17040 [Holophagaceae bacterium]|uniref:Bacterial virulence factor lipase N-terminal domain-containing protein n=1 Tax=Candidatus Geothrix skivensis TaxID=2954439 RepID=A0A9D7XJX9_9BACT|nr:hypothetical protein [Candidatus Geothrix skivensis]
MHRRLNEAALGTLLLTLLACTGGGDSKAPTIVTGPGSMPSTTTAIFDPSTGAVPLPNVLVTATSTSITYTATTTPAPGTLNITPGFPLTPDKALAFVNLKEMGGTQAVSGLNAPIYIGFNAAVDTATVNGSNIKVFQLLPDVPTNPSSTENNALGFVDVSGLFTFSTITLTPSGVGVYALPKVPLLPGARYLYVVTNRVKDAAGLPVSAAPFFEALKSTTTLTGSFAALEPIRANALVSGTANIQLSGYAKVMSDLIAATATTTITQRGDIALLGRFITTGAGYIPTDPANPTPALAAVRIPVEMALWAWANNAPIPNTVDFSSGESRTWSNAVSGFTQLASETATPGSVAAFYTANGLGTAPNAAIGLIAAGAFESANLQIDPYAVGGVPANVSISGNITAATGLTYNPGTSVLPGSGVLQASRNATGKLRGFYHTSRTVPFLVLAPATGTGPYPVAIFMHGIGGQKEQVLGLANTLCASGYVVIAIDQVRHGGLADGRPSAEWASNFFMLPSILTARTNVQNSAFNLWRLERILKQPTGDPTGLQAAMTTAGKSLSTSGATQYVGQSLGSIVGAYFLAGNSIQTGGSNMKGLLSVPGARIGFILKDSPAFAATVNAGLAAAGVPTGSAAYYQFFALAQAVADPIDPATMGTPLSGQTTSRLANRLLVQEAVGDTVIPNANGQYFVNAFAGRQGQLGGDVSVGFTQILRASQTAPAVPYVYGTTLATFKTAVAAATAAGSGNPAQGVMQYGTPAAPAAHGLLLQDATTPANVAAAQRQMAIWVAAGTVADGAATNGYPLVSQDVLTPMQIPGLFGPESLVIHYPTKD